MRTRGWVRGGCSVTGVSLGLEPGGGAQTWGTLSVGPVGGVGVAGLAALGLRLHSPGLTALSRTTLCVLCQVVVQQLRVGLLMWGQDVQERSRSVTGGTSWIQGSRPTQG